MKKRRKNITNKASYEAYLNALFIEAVNTQGTPTASIDEILLAKAMSYECAVDEAKVYVKRTLNVQSDWFPSDNSPPLGLSLTDRNHDGQTVRSTKQIQ